MFERVIFIVYLLTANFSNIPMLSSRQIWFLAFICLVVGDADHLSSISPIDLSSPRIYQRMLTVILTLWLESIVQRISYLEPTPRHSDRDRTNISAGPVVVVLITSLSTVASLSHWHPSSWGVQCMVHLHLPLHLCKLLYGAISPSSMTSTDGVNRYQPSVCSLYEKDLSDGRVLWSSTIYPFIGVLLASQNNCLHLERHIISWACIPIERYSSPPWISSAPFESGCIAIKWRIVIAKASSLQHHRRSCRYYSETSLSQTILDVSSVWQENPCFTNHQHIVPTSSDDVPSPLSSAILSISLRHCLQRRLVPNILTNINRKDSQDYGISCCINLYRAQHLSINWPPSIRRVTNLCHCHFSIHFGFDCLVYRLMVPFLSPLTLVRLDFWLHRTPDSSCLCQIPCHSLGVERASFVYHWLSNQKSLS